MAGTTKTVDCTHAGRGVWLVKVPKYLSNRWTKIQGTEVGRLRITKQRMAGAKPEIIFSSNDAIMDIKESDEGDVPMPKDHKFVMNAIISQELEVLVHSQMDENNALSRSSESSMDGDKMTLFGKIIQRAECRPIADANYLKLKRNQIEMASKPQRLVQQLNKIVINYKPVSDHKHNIEYELKKKAEGKKARDDKEKVMEKLYEVFERHQYYNIKDLVRITEQPVIYLKEILKEICNYNLKNPHKNMWELKPEYRHYKEPKEEKA